MSNDIQQANGGSTRETMRSMQIRKGGVLLENYEQMWVFSKTAAASGLVPQGFEGKPEKVMIAVQMGAELGLAPMTSLRTIAVINGRPSLWGDGLLAIVRNSSTFKDIDETLDGDGEKMVATCTVWRTDREKPIARSFSVDDAKQAGLWKKKGPWTDYPRRMLQLRARGFALRDAFPDALGGFMLAEEARDIAQNANDGHESRSDAMLAALEENAPVDVEHQPVEPEVPEGQADDLPPEPTPDEEEEIRQREMAEAGLFPEGSDE